MYAASESHFNFHVQVVTGFFHAFVGAIEDDFYSITLQASFFQQIYQAHTTPAGITYQALEQSWAIASTFKTGVNFKFLVPFQICQGKFQRGIYQAGDIESICRLCHFRLVIMLNDIKIIIGGIKAVYLGSIQIMDAAGSNRGHSVAFRHIGKLYELLGGAQCQC